jgi:beta-lactam-binding protein with PASTA domain
MTLLKKIGNFIWSKTFLYNFAALILLYLLLFWVLNMCLDSRTRFGEKVAVPNLIGKNENNVKNLLSNTGLEYEVLDSIYDPTKIEGTVLEQDPLPTSLSQVSVKSGRTIKLRVSKRTQLVEMPGLVNKSQRFAEGILRNRKFKYRLEYKPSKEAHGAVLEQLYKGKPIAAGTKIPIGSSVKLVIGRDEVGVPVPLPNLIGLTIVEARERVDAMLNMEFMVVCPPDYTKNDSLVARVVSQTPEYAEDAVIPSGGSIQVFATKDGAQSPE